MNKKSISIIIVNYNSEKFIHRTLESIKSTIPYTALAYELLILDNNSGDRSPGMIKDFIAKNRMIPCRIITSDTNMGFAKAVNLLVKKARFDIIMLINADTEILELTNIIEHITNGKMGKNEIITPGLYNQDMTRQRNYFFYPNSIILLSELFMFKNPLEKILYRKKIIDKKTMVIKSDKIYLSACFLVFHKSLFTQCNGFDENFVFYHEECDWFFGLKKYNVVKKILNDRVIHIGSGGKEITDYAFCNYFTGLFIFFKKYNLIGKRILKLLFSIAFSLRIFLIKHHVTIPYSPFYYGHTNKKITNKERIITMHNKVVAEIDKV